MFRLINILSSIKDAVLGRRVDLALRGLGTASGVQESGTA